MHKSDEQYLKQFPYGARVVYIGRYIGTVKEHELSYDDERCKDHGHDPYDFRYDGGQCTHDSHINDVLFRVVFDRGQGKRWALAVGGNLANAGVLDELAAIT